MKERRAGHASVFDGERGILAVRLPTGRYIVLAHPIALRWEGPGRMRRKPGSIRPAVWPRAVAHAAAGKRP